MKKLKIVLFLLCITSMAMSQTIPPPPPPTQTVVVSAPPPPPQSTWESFRLGLEVEPLISWAKAKDNTISTTGIKPNFGFGIMGDFFFSKNYALNLALTFVYVAAPITYDTIENFNIPSKGTISYPSNTMVDYKLEYVEVPIDFKLKTDQIGYLSYFGQFGGVLGLNIASKGDFTTPTGVDNFTNVTLSSNVNLLNIGLLIGAGVEYNIVGHTNLIAGISYVNNFTNFTGKPANAALNHLNLNLGVYF